MVLQSQKAKASHCNPLFPTPPSTLKWLGCSVQGLSAEGMSPQMQRKKEFILPPALCISKLKPFGYWKLHPLYCRDKCQKWTWIQGKPLTDTTWAGWRLLTEVYKPCSEDTGQRREQHCSGWPGSHTIDSHLWVITSERGSCQIFWSSTTPIWTSFIYWKEHSSIH